nr:immunoglobulin light chain junction region [Macaca mulatta]MOV82500.1 immunoglobulin light chain junction region [Macaca mulatta]
CQQRNSYPYMFSF